MALSDLDQKKWMEKALEQAMMRRGFCAPNPAVGAVVVRDDMLLASGTHWASGQAHAEVDALGKVAGQARGAALFVTLEPCCHWGKTPPCTKAIIEAGISAVYYGFLDPNPVVAGQGVRQLEQAGIACKPCFLPEVEAFYRSYAYWRQTGRPWVTAKLALSADGKIAAKGGRPAQITGEALRALTHASRQKSDAILTTITTIQNDDPQLNVRLEGVVDTKPLYVLDTTLGLPLHAKILNTTTSITVFHGADASTERRLALESKGVRCVPIHEVSGGLSLSEVLAVVGKDGFHDLWVEAGGRCFRSFYEANLLQRALIYVSQKILGHEACDAGVDVKALSADAKSVVWERFGEDQVCDLVFEKG